jgi:hypothetical protein
VASTVTIEETSTVTLIELRAVLLAMFVSRFEAKLVEIELARVAADDAEVLLSSVMISNDTDIVFVVSKRRRRVEIVTTNFLTLATATPTVAATVSCSSLSSALVKLVASVVNESATATVTVSAAVGAREGVGEGAGTGAWEGLAVGSIEGDGEGTGTGARDGFCTGCEEGFEDGAGTGKFEGAETGNEDGSVGLSIGCGVGAGTDVLL